MINLQGKTAVVFGLANKRSIAWAIAQKLNEAGARIAICYQNERLRKEADALLPELNAAQCFQCDVSNDGEIAATFDLLQQVYGTLDMVVHSVAFAPAEAMKNSFVETKRDDFRIALDVSAYSLIAIARAAVPLMPNGGSILTLTHYGADKVFPNYNVMGVAKSALEATVRYLAAALGPRNIRVNAISAGAIKTLAARGIGDLQAMLDHGAQRAPLHRNVDTAEVGNTAAFLLSPLASGITGEITFVDCGYNTVGM